MNAPLHIPPYSTESEQALLGGILADAKLFDAVADIITEADFYDHGHRLLFRRIALLVAQNKPVDLVTVEAALQGAGEAEAVGGFAYLADLSVFSPGAGSVKRYASIIRDRRLLRDLMCAANEIGDIATALTDEPAAARLDKAEGILLALGERSASQASEPTEMAAILSSVVESIQERYDNPGAVKGLSTGFVDFDARTHGLQRGNLIIIAGRPSMGKTTWALNIAENVALAGGCSLVFSMEMSKDELANRSLSSVGGIALDAILDGKLTEQDFSNLSFAMGKLSNANLIIDDTPALSLAQIRARARRVNRKHRLSLIVIDYLQLAKGDSQHREQEIAQISRGLKAIAKELDVPVIALSQLSRKVEDRTDKRPMMSDLRESGSIEQDADVIVMMYRDEYYDKNSAFKGLAEAVIRKQRNGALGDVHLAFQGHYCRFRSVSPDAWRQAAQQAQDDKPVTRARRGMDA